MANIMNALGAKSPSVEVFPRPKSMKRAPLTTDMGFKKGQLWIHEDHINSDDIYILSSKRGGLANWLNLGGGGGSFDTLTVTGNSVIGGTLRLSLLGAGTIRSAADGTFSSLLDGDDGEIQIGTTGGIPTWNTITAGAGITVTNAAGNITIDATGATASTFVTDAGGPIAPNAGATTVIGYDANITTDGNTANTIKVKLADNISSVGSITAASDLTMTAGSCTITSTDNAADAIYLHANGGTNEKIVIYSQQGTGADSVEIWSDVGGVQLISNMANGSAIYLGATNAIGGIDITAGTGGVVAGIIDGDFEIQVGVGNIILATSAEDHDVTIGASTGSSAMALSSGTGHTALTSTGDITLVPDGDAKINTTAGNTYIASTAVAQNVSIATGAAQMTLTLGNTTSASSVVVEVGTGSASFGASATAHSTIIGSLNTTSNIVLQSGTGSFVQTAGGIWDVNSVGNVTIDSTGGTLGIGEGADAQNINIGTGAAARIITAGNITGATSIVLNVGTGNLDLGVSATSHTTRLGSTSGTCDTTIQTGSGAMTFTAGGALDANVATDITFDSAGGIFDVSVTGNITIDSSAGTIGIGVDDIDQAINIATAGERVVTIGNQVGVAGVVIESGSAGIALNGLGLTSVELLEDTQAGAAVTINGNNGAGIFTGLTTAAAGVQQLTITNNVCTVNSRIMYGIMNKGANDARINVERVTPGAGSFTVDVINSGAAALNGDIVFTFWIMKL